MSEENRIEDTEDQFADTEDEFRFHLVRAEHHAQKALDLLYKSPGPKRSLWYRMLLGRAQSILIGLYVQEEGRRNEGRSK